jgi:hypothetical protein
VFVKVTSSGSACLETEHIDRLHEHYRGEERHGSEGFRAFFCLGASHLGRTARVGRGLVCCIFLRLDHFLNSLSRRRGFFATLVDVTTLVIYFCLGIVQCTQTPALIVPAQKPSQPTAPLDSLKNESRAFA